MEPEAATVPSALRSIPKDLSMKKRKSARGKLVLDTYIAIVEEGAAGW